MRRLVRGLGSSSKAARQGFAAALAGALEVLSTAGLVDASRAADLVDEVLPTPTANMSRPDAKDRRLGRLFALGAVTRSGPAPAVAPRLLAGVMEVWLASPFLREAAGAVVLDLLGNLASEDAEMVIRGCQPLVDALHAEPEARG